MADRITNQQLKRLFLASHLLSDLPTGAATRDRLDQLIHKLGFVQVDTISTLEQAHHHILATRLFGYKKSHLKHLLESRRSLFEHWTHDASIIPTCFYPYWKLQFKRIKSKIHSAPHWEERFAGRQGQAIRVIRERVREEGPLRSRDVTPDDAEERGTWWGWTPSKAALEYLWRTGEFAVTRRDGFQKVYDLTENVIPGDHLSFVDDASANVDWLCREAISRLGVATHAEIAAYFDAITPAMAAEWCGQASPDVLRRVEIEHDDGSLREVWARADILEQLNDSPDPLNRLRFLSPFDPMIRDRGRAERYLGFDYRFEAFVPAKKRVFGYYVLPILEADRFVGRIELKAHRDKGKLEVRGHWWEPGVRRSKARDRRLEAEIDRWRRFSGLDEVFWSCSRDGNG